MKRFVIERSLPGAGTLTSEELASITSTSCSVVADLRKPYHWIQSFVTDDKIFCIHLAESEEVIREHAQQGNFPVTAVYEVKSVIDPTTK